MGYANRSTLAQAIQDWAGRSDARFVAQIPNFIASAEHRVYYGSDEGEAIQTNAVRVRQMEIELEATPQEGDRVMEVTLPERYLAMRRLYLDTDFTHPFSYITPQEFWTDSRVSPGGSVHGAYGWLGYPRIYTIEGNSVFIAPFGDGTAKIQHFQRFPSLVNDTDTNWLLQETDLLFWSSMAYAWAFARNTEEETKAMRRYAGLASGMNSSEQKGRRSGQSIAPQTVGRGMGDRGAWRR